MDPTKGITLSSLPVQCLDRTTLGSLWSWWGGRCPSLRKGSPSCPPSTICAPTLELLEELTCASPPGPCNIPVWLCVVTLPHSPQPGICSTTLDDPVGTEPRRRGRRGPTGAGSILEWLSCHYHTHSEDLALAAAVTGTPRWWPMAGQAPGVTLRREERAERRGEDGQVLAPVARGAWSRCGSLLPCFPLSLSLRALPGTVEREERAGGRASSRHELREDQRSRARSLPVRTGGSLVVSPGRA